MARRKGGNLGALADEECVRKNEKHLILVGSNGGEGNLELTDIARFNEVCVNPHA